MDINVMDITERTRSDATSPVRYALTGACGGFGRTLLAQTRYVPGLSPAVLCDLDTGGLRALWAELGLPDDGLRVCRTPDEVRRAGSDPDVTLAVPDTALLAETEFDILVEATGNPAVGYAAAVAALTAGRHVAMASKEVDSVAGVRLSRLAARHGVVYTPAGGDQPANVLGLLRWGRLIGLDVVALGKSSEYDLVLDPESETVTQQDMTVAVPGMSDLLTLGDDVRGTLAARAALVEALPRRSSADYCEMSVVSHHSGFQPDVPELHYPVARIDELADVYALREDGGLLATTGALDVFSALRLPGEASFAGGVFLIVRTHDDVTWRMLREKGHVVSRDGRYACVYLPFHLMGVETPFTLLTAVHEHRGAAGPGGVGRSAVLAGRAVRDLPAGTELRMHGHHHEVDGLEPALLTAQDAGPGTAPYYLAANARTARDVRAGTVLTLTDLTGYDTALAQASHAEPAQDA
ncbi:homoserine dehydrogenase [Streptomyces sp. NPDC059398]|uniref:homoserine dehydrogenase n=1 Tax=Streptomyces sp. NPDC059398 TaxID=3346820 RepID=UPI0036C3A5BB